MSHLLTSGQVGNIGMNHMKAIRQEIQTKWNSLGFLDGLKGHVRENVATLYENQATTLLSEATTATNSGSFETVVFPIVRRVFSKLLANDIVSVQAMNMPIGKLFFFVPLTSSRVNEAGVAGNPYTTSDSTDVWGANAQYSAHTGMAAQGIPSCVVGASCVVTPFLAKNMYDIFYNDGLFDNSKGTLTIQVKTPLPVFTLGTDGTFTIVNTSGAV
jgi:hypothetical protein